MLVLPLGMAPAAATAITPRNPLAEAVRRAPLGEPFTPEQRAELDQAMADIAAGRVELVPQDEVPAWLEARTRELGR